MHDDMVAPVRWRRGCCTDGEPDATWDVAEAVRASKDSDDGVCDDRRPLFTGCDVLRESTGAACGVP